MDSIPEGSKERDSAQKNLARQCSGQIKAGIWLLFASIATSASASEPLPSCAEDLSPKRGGTVNLRVDNDMFGGLGQDQGYSNGFLLSVVSPNLAGYGDDPCLPRIVRYLNRYLSWLQPAGFDEQNMTLGIGQMMYTPTERERRDVIANDRPYAGALLLSIGYNARKDTQLRTTQLRLGVVGPAARAGQMQNWWHGVMGADRFRGWHQQLRNEPVLQLLHERRKRVARHEQRNGWGWDLAHHWGASLGNFATYANVGGEWRFGYHLPDDFGTAPLRPAGENTSPVRVPRTDGWSGHFFAAIDARWVMRDITLDGNTFRSSHSVRKRPFVADLGYGFALYRGHWRLAVARYHRTREFRGQKKIPVYGTITLGRRF